MHALKRFPPHHCRVLRVFICCASVWLSALVSRARSGATLEDGYSIRVWQAEDGLPQNSITTVTQTHDGYIWIGTYGGLARFDGEQFRTFDAVNTPELHDSRIVSLFEDSQGNLWIGHDSGTITRYHAGHFEYFLDRKAEGADKVVAMNEDAAGSVWALRQKGTLESVDGTTVLRTKRLLNDPGLVHLTQSPGTVWVRADGMVYKLDHHSLEAVDFGPARYTDYVLGIGGAKDGGLWVVRDLSLRKWRDGKWVEDLGPCPWEQSSISAIVELSNGDIAVGTMERGLYILRRHGPTVHFDQSNGLPQNWVRCLYEDAEGNVWAGAGTAGMAVIRSTAVRVISAPDQWAGRTVLSIAPGPRNSLWIGTEGAGLYAFRDGQWTHYGEGEGIKNQFVWSVAQGPNEQMWIGTWGAGVYRLQGNWFNHADEMPIEHSPVFALLFKPKGDGVWVGTNSGLLYRDGTGASWSFRDSDGQPAGVSDLALDASGALWCAMPDSGLGRYENGKLTVYTKRNGLSSNAVQSLLVDGEGTLWIGTADGGLNRFKEGKFAAIGMDQGLPSNAICHLAEDKFGYIWMSTHHGIVRVAKSELSRCAEGKISTVATQLFDQDDGLPTIEFSGGMQAAGCETSDGHIYFSSSRGVISVDPSEVRTNPVAPPVVVESFRVDGRGVDLETRSFKPVAPDNQRLEFKYTALSFSAPSRVLFKYKLEGLDHDWVDAGPKRIASYSHLAAGKYRFRVIACNDAGVWSPLGAAYGFTVSAYFWETTWFVVLVSFVVLSLVALAVRGETRRRMRRDLEEVERERSIDRERSRIAQDIHDDIGATLTRITMLSQSAAEGVQASVTQSVALENIHSTARELTRSLDEIVWAVDPRHDTLDSLVNYMGKFAQDFLSAAGVRCRLDLPMQLPSWPLVAQTRHHLFLAFKETLNNAIKHADATEVKISLTLKTDAFVVTVKDNGKGFSPNLEPSVRPDRISSGHGLANLQRRLATIGGQCEILANDGEGTSVAFVVRVAASPTVLASPPV